LDAEQKAFTVNAPVHNYQSPIWGDQVYNISDLIFYLLGLKVLKIAGNKAREDSGLVRLSLRNFMWYCYLDQNKLDSTFFRHEDSSKTRNSKEILKYILQYSTQKLIELEEKLQEYRKQRFTDTSTVERLRDFLKQFGFSTLEEIDTIGNDIKEKLNIAKRERKDQESGYMRDTHNSDRLRAAIRALIADISRLEESLYDLENRIRQQESLRSELIASKFKLAKNESIVTLFQGVDFDNCPNCGTNIKSRVTDEHHCKLCGSEVGQIKPTLQEQAEVIQTDLDDRVRDLDASIDLHRTAFAKAKRELAIKQKRRTEYDLQLGQELQQYESIFLSNIRKVDQTIAKLTERLRSLERLKKMPEEINRLQENADNLLKAEHFLRQKIREEKLNLVKGESIIEELELEFLRTLLEVGVPGVTEEDKVYINRKTWDVSIWPKSQEHLKWNFYNAGSGGKKTLFNSCFMLALHVVAAKNDLPLPTFIIIDTPMKNIDKEINLEIFYNYFTYVYRLAADVLDQTQFVIIDNNFIPAPLELNLTFYDRIMTADEKENPPLIRYYRGP
ncbi:MAG: hypothetical protein JST19_21595, partial [Bacteroidetes bacterium]|nr:hypothetical protein [Bacteroidota bacterium]